MCLLSPSNRSNDKTNTRSENGASWKDFEPKNSKDRLILINIANNKCKLLNILHQYKIKPENNGKDWSVSLRCPFSSHKRGYERTPSFGYNFKDDRFYCFGCGEGGRAVEFFALKESVSKVEAAKQIINISGGYTIDDEIEAIDEIDPQIEKILFNFSSYIQKLNQKYKHDQVILDQISKITYVIDSYIINKVPQGGFLVEELEARCNRTYALLHSLGL